MFYVANQMCCILDGTIKNCFCSIVISNELVPVPVPVTYYFITIFFSSFV